MWCDTFSGSHYEIGLQLGRRYGPWIERTLRTFVSYHDFDLSPDELADMAEHWRSLLAARTPELLEQIEGIREGARVNFAELLAMNFRAWDMLAERRAGTPGKATAGAAGGCTNIAVTDPDQGAVLVGSLDDVQTPWHLARFAPRDRYRHVCITWVGSAWASRGINEKGLAFGSSSMAVEGLNSLAMDRFADIALKNVLETAATVGEAIAAFRALGPFRGISVIFADALGDMKLIESNAAGDAVHELENGVLFCLNHVKDTILRKKMTEAGYRHRPTVWSDNRERLIDRTFADAASPRTRKQLETMFCDHDGYPDSMCWQAVAYATVAAPQVSPDAWWVSDRPSCHRQFERLNVER